MNAPGWSTEILAGLSRVHAVLRRSLDKIVQVASGPIAAGDREGFARFTECFVRFLEVHHDGEEEIVFPALTAAAGRAAVEGVAGHVATWRADHQKLLDLLARLKAAGAEFQRGGPSEPLREAAVGLRQLLVPHLNAEESALDGALLAKLMPMDEAMAMITATSKHGQRHGGPRVLMMFVHALNDDEQRAHFGRLPWFVRKILLKRVWARAFRPCLAFAYNPSVAL